ncbi:MAG TPA: L,D-transpeptidase [Acidimicrobiales bacterium]|nr:L,D-transpeptidase [Acidimicrobiales bacterium]
MARRVVLGLAAAVLLAACGSGGSVRSTSTSAPATTSPPPTVPTTEPPPRSVVATAIVPSVNVYDSPGQPEPVRALEHPVKPQGTPLVFLVVEEQPEWLEVVLPVRPNGSTGWIRSSDVTLASHDFRIVVELGAHRLTVWKGNDVFAEEPIAVGREQTPTPGGHFYTFQLLKPVEEQDRQAYGEYAYALSGFSEVLTSFMGGEGRLAIHGTMDPSSVGQDVSFGCIRMTNEAITRLTTALPLGVPVEIRS